MDLFDRFNSKFGKWYEGLFGADADEIRPRDVLRKIITAMEDNRKEGLDRKIYVPNRYVVHVTVSDQNEREYLLSFLDEDELVGVLTRFMAQNGYQTRGPLDFTIAEDPDPTPEARAQKLTVTARFEKGQSAAQTPMDLRPAPVAAPPAPPLPPSPPATLVVEDGYDDEPETVPLIARAGLAITSADGRKRHFSLSHKRITIGRSRHQSNDVLLDDDGMVSKVHAAIAWSADGRFTLSDLQSTNGVVVNGARIDDSVVLRDGDEILIGGTQLKFEQEEVRTAFKPAQTPASEAAAAYLIDPDGKQHYLGSHTEIGSALTADLAFHDRGLCTRHARIVCEAGDSYYLIPLTSDQKTEHNGRIIQQGARALLSNGDYITLGSLDLGFRRSG